MIAKDLPPRAQVCESCGSASIGIGRAENIRGQRIYPYYCLDCGFVITQYAGKKKVQSYIRETGLLPIEVKTATQEKIAAGKLDPSDFDHMKPCEVCGNIGDTELHHWAPYHLFGDDCDDWPMSYLCLKHHTEWHKTVTPDMGKAKRV